MFLVQCNHPGCNEHSQSKTPSMPWNCGRHISSSLSVEERVCHTLRQKMQNPEALPELDMAPARHTIDLSNSSTWAAQVARVAGLGAQHASLRQKAFTEKQLMSHLAIPGVVVYHRRFHSRLLRSAYGAGYNGVKLAAEAKAKGL